MHLSSTAERSSSYSRPWLHKGSGHWCMHIGYRMTDQRKRVRAFHTFGRDETDAISRAVSKQNEWRQAVADWPARRSVLQQHLPSFDWSRPVLNDSPPILRLQQRLTHDLLAHDGLFARVDARVKRHAEEKDRAELEDIAKRNPYLISPQGSQHGPTNPTIGEAKERFLAAKEAQVGLAGGRGIKLRTMGGIRKMLTLALGQSTAKGKPRVLRQPIDLDRTVGSLTLADLRAYVDYWMGLPGGIGDRTAVNYVRHMRSLLMWCEESEDIQFEMPKGAGRVFRLRSSKSFHIAQYEPDILRKLLSEASSRIKLCILLGLNCGYYQQDISDLTPDDLVQHEGEWCLWRGRSKTTHQNDFQTLHWLFPQTYELIQLERARRDNRWGRLLLNNHGMPLMYEVAGRGPADHISYAYDRYRRKLNVSLTFKQFRKLGWNAIKRLSGGSLDVARKYAGQVISGVARHYNRDEFDDVTDALKKWHEELLRDGVL